MGDRDDQVDRQLAAMRNALTAIANYGDCDYELEPEDERPKPCTCPQCTAKQALEAERDWRIRGAMHHRTNTMPREGLLVEAMRKHFHLNQSAAQADRKLSLILDEAERGINGDFKAPSVRDWYVAASVIQWLGTNVGSCLLEEAGFHYQRGTVFNISDLRLLHYGLACAASMLKDPADQDHKERLLQLAERVGAQIERG